MRPEYTICGIGYKCIEREGSIIFTEATPIFAHGSRVAFQREDAKSMWYFDVGGESTRIPAPHLVQMYRHVLAAHSDAYGGNDIDMRELQ